MRDHIMSVNLSSVPSPSGGEPSGSKKNSKAEDKGKSKGKQAASQDAHQQKTQTKTEFSQVTQDAKAINNALKTPPSTTEILKNINTNWNKTGAEPAPQTNTTTSTNSNPVANYTQQLATSNIKSPVGASSGSRITTLLSQPASVQPTFRTSN